MREADRRQNQPIQVLGNESILPVGTMPPLPLIHPAFGTGPTFYMSPVALICRPDDILSLTLGQHSLDYEPIHGFVIPPFAKFDGSVDPYDHMLYYNQTMILNVDKDQLLCKVFLANLQGPLLA